MEAARMLVGGVVEAAGVSEDLGRIMKGRGVRGEEGLRNEISEIGEVKKKMYL